MRITGMTYRLSARIMTQAAHTPDRAHTSQRTPAAHSLSLRRVAITNTPEAARAKLSPLPTADLCADNSPGGEFAWMPFGGAWRGLFSIFGVEYKKMPRVRS